MRRRGDTETHQTSREASAPAGSSEAFGGPGALVGLRRRQNLGKEIEEGSQGLGCRQMWQKMGKEGWDRAGDRRLKAKFEIWWEPGKTGSDDQAGSNAGREREPGSRK